ncbi:MAG TPA: AMP-binding protein, partial [Ideonella sp.]|nr:AMP-binding protein [Ideonella sp.]
MAATVHALFAATAARTPGADFLCVEPVTARAWGLAPCTLGWGDAAREVERLRAAYAAAGWGHGHRVGLLLQNRPAFLFHWFALNALGASVVPINPELRAAELEYLIGHSEIALAVALPARADDLRRAAQAAGRRLETLAIPAGAAVPSAPVPPLRADRPIGADTECALLYTSGTTG